MVRPAPGLLLRGGGSDYHKDIVNPFFTQCEQRHLRNAWFLLADAIYAEEKVIGGEPASTWEEDVIIVVSRVTLKENARC